MDGPDLSRPRVRRKSLDDIYKNPGGHIPLPNEKPLPGGSRTFQHALTDLIHDQSTIQESDEEEEEDEEEAYYTSGSEQKDPKGSKKSEGKTKKKSKQNSDTEETQKHLTENHHHDMMKFFAQHGRWPGANQHSQARRHSVCTVPPALHHHHPHPLHHPNHHQHGPHHPDAKDVH